MAAQLWQDFMEAPTYFNHSPWFPNPLVCARDMAIFGFKEVNERLPWNGMGVWLEETVVWVDKSVNFDMYCVLVPLLIAMLLTILRMTLNGVLFNVSVYCLFSLFVWSLMDREL